MIKKKVVRGICYKCAPLRAESKFDSSFNRLALKVGKVGHNVL